MAVPTSALRKIHKSGMETSDRPFFSTRPKGPKTMNISKFTQYSRKNDGKIRHCQRSLNYWHKAEQEMPRGFLGHTRSFVWFGMNVVLFLSERLFSVRNRWLAATTWAHCRNCQLTSPNSDPHLEHRAEPHTGPMIHVGCVVRSQLISGLGTTSAVLPLRSNTVLWG